MSTRESKPYRIILASKSPRRQQLLKDTGISFEVAKREVEEHYPEYLRREQVALHLCRAKAAAFENELDDDTLVITADTIVCVDHLILNKPVNRENAIEMLRMLSGRKHEVITAVCLKAKHKTISFFASTAVYFRELSMEEIAYYIDHYQPYDKAGAYAIQEWIGQIGIEKIEGSYSNVVGLPLNMVYDALNEFWNAC